MKLLIDCPKNCCAFVSAIDMLKYSNFIKNLDIKESVFPCLISTLKDDGNCSIGGAIREICQWALEKNVSINEIG